MKLIELLNMDKKNELYFDKNTKMQQIFVFVSMIYFIGFDVCLIKEYLTMGNSIFIFFACFSIAIIFQDYINHQVEQKLFDVIIYENDTKADFKDEENLIKTESDYNTLRRMLGYEEVKLDRNHFLIYTKKRLVHRFQKFFENEKIEIGEQSLLCAGFYFEGFSQNGADE